MTRRLKTKAPAYSVFFNLENIDLNIITSEHIQGKWNVLSRSPEATPQGGYFSGVESIDFDTGKFSASGKKPLKGELTLIREYKIIFNPQLTFYNSGDEIGNAIITRLIQDRHGDKDNYKMTLYFTTGLELILHKN